MASVAPTTAIFAARGLLDGARTVSEALPALRARVGGTGESLAACGADGVLATVPEDSRRPGPDLRVIGGAALVRAGGRGQVLFLDRAGPLAVAVDGRATNAGVLTRALVQRGAVFTGLEPAELLVHLMAQSEQRTLMNRLVDAIRRMEGGFSIVAMTAELMVGVRDLRGIRPLCLGRRGAGWALASESSVLRASGVTWEREVAPGEVLVVGAPGVESLRPFGRESARPCAAEWLGAAGPDAGVGGVDVIAVGERVGVALAKEFPVRGDVVVPLPGSEALAAGFSAGSGLRLLPALVVDGGQARASNAVRGLRCALVVNLLATGERTRRAVAALRAAGASEVHVRLGALPLIAGCLYGVATPPEEDLLARRFEIPRMRSWLDADSLAHPERAPMLACAGVTPNTACDGCFSGEYPVVPLDPQVPLFPKPGAVW